MVDFCIFSYKAEMTGEKKKSVFEELIEWIYLALVLNTYVYIKWICTRRKKI